MSEDETPTGDPQVIAHQEREQELLAGLAQANAAERAWAAHSQRAQESHGHWAARLKELEAMLAEHQANAPEEVGG